jgi:serine/threonine-protein kinase
MTSTAAVIGTAQYLSPEQARGEGVDARSDVYSLGCLLYELVTGAPPFTGDSPVAVAYQHVREDPRLPSSINPAIPPELDAILLKAMSKNPANRYQSAADMRHDLLRALAGQRVEATPVMNDAEKTTILGATPGYGDEDWEDDDAARKRRRNRVIALVAAGLLLIGVVVAVALLLNPADEEEPPAVAQVAVPTLVGLQQAEAETALTDAGLEVGEVTTSITDDDAAVGTVLESTPASGAQVDEGTAVALVVGVGPDTVTVPPVVDLDVDRARTTLENAGFTSVDTEQVDSLAPEGQVVEVDPEEGTEVDPGTRVTLSVSDGDAELPPVTGQAQDAAAETLRTAGFTNVSTEEVDSDQPVGTVVGSSPAAGSQATADTRITLQVSRGPAEPETIAVPQAAAQGTPANALAALRSAGFTNIAVLDTSGGEADPATATRVLSVDPGPGSQAAADDRIVLTVEVPTTPPGGDPGAGGDD